MSRSNKNSVLSVLYLFLLPGFIKIILGHQETLPQFGSPCLGKGKWTIAHIFNGSDDSINNFFTMKNRTVLNLHQWIIAQY